MVAKNEHTGDAIRSKVLSKQGEENWERIFGNKNKSTGTLEMVNKVESKTEVPRSLDAAYQRKAIDDGYTFSEEGLFEENKQYYKDMREAYKNINDKLEEKYKIMEPLLDSDGEVRELTETDFSNMKPLKDVLCTVCGNCLKDVLDCNKNSCPKNEET